MRSVIIIVGILVGLMSSAEAGRRRASGLVGTGSASKSSTVRGYKTKSGAVVAPYRRTKSDQTQRNNYSTKNNYNPWTGKTGKRYATH